VDQPIPVTVQSKVDACIHLLAGNSSPNPDGEARKSDFCECCALSGGVYERFLSLIQRSPTECGVSERDREASITRTPTAE